MTDPQKTVIAAALGIALGFAVAGNDKPKTKPADVEQSTKAKRVDVAEYHRVMREVRDEQPNTIDMLTEEVPPGAEVTAFVNCDVQCAHGERPSSVEYIGAADGKFVTTSLTHAVRNGATEIVLRARNTSDTTMRLTALVTVR